MSKVEKFIQENTRNCSNVIYDPYDTGDAITIYAPWLTPDRARKAVEIAKEEIVNEVCEWLDSHTMLSEKWYIEDLKKHLEDRL